MCPDDEDSSRCPSEASNEMSGNEQLVSFDFTAVKVLENLHVKVGKKVLLQSKQEVGSVTIDLPCFTF